MSKQHGTGDPMSGEIRRDLGAGRHAGATPSYPDLTRRELAWCTTIARCTGCPPVWL